MKFREFLEKRPHTILLLLVALISVHSLKYSFLIIDDLDLIVNNPRLRFSLSEILAVFSTPLGQIYDYTDYPMNFIYYRPALNLLYMFNKTIWGINPVGFHITNLILHLLTSIFIYQAGLNLFKHDKLVSLIAASFFCVHPVHNELIGRVAMNENLLGFFIVTSFYFYLINKKSLSLAAFAFALLSKESAVMFPIVILLMEKREKELKYAVSFMIPYGYLLILYLVVRMTVIGIPVDFIVWSELSESTMLVCSALADYIRLLFVPYPLHVFYQAWEINSLFDPDLLVSIVICLLLGYVAWKWRGDKRLSPLLLATVLMLLPAIFLANKLILGVERGYIAERQLYVPAIFFSLMIAGVIGKNADSPVRKYVVVAFMGVIPVFMYTTISTSMVWENDNVLRSRFIRDFPNISLSHKYRGQFLFEQGDLDGALVEFAAALPSTTSGDRRLLNQNSRVSILGNKPNPDDSGRNGNKHSISLTEFLTQHSLNNYLPEYADVHFQMGQVYLAKNDIDRAIRKFKVALLLQPHYLGGRSLLAESYLKKGLIQDARREFSLALKDINFNKIVSGSE